MRIGYLVPEFPSQTHIFFWREIRVLRSQGAKLHLLSTSRPQLPSRHDFAAAAMAETRYLFPPRWGKAGFYLLARPVLVLRMLGYLASLEDTAWLAKLRLLGLIFCAGDLLVTARDEGLGHIHGHSCADVAHLLAMADQCNDLPYSLTLHGDLAVYGGEHKAKFAKAQFIACVTHALQNQVEESCGMDRKRLPVIRMGVELEVFRPGPSRQMRAGTLRCITVARLARCKGHIYALRALRRVIDQGLQASYTIVGDGDDRSLIEKAIQDLKLQPYVRLVGTAGEHEVLSFLQNSDCFVLSSVGHGEAAPVSVMEAMACQLPVVASRIGGTPELIKSGVNGLLVEQADVEGLAKALFDLGSDINLRQSLAIEARTTAEAQFSAEHFAAELHRAILAKGAE